MNTQDRIGDGRMKIGETVKFTGIYEGDESKPYSLTGTVADIRDGHAFVFCIGQRWPFTIAANDTSRRGYYPRTVGRRMSDIMNDITGETFPYGLTVEQMEQAAYSLELAFERNERASFDVHLDAMRAIRQLLQEKAEMAEVLSVLMKKPPMYRDFSNDATCCGYCHRDIDQNSHHDECAWAIASGLLMGVDVRQDAPASSAAAK
jgi:hypothetical protein